MGQQLARWSQAMLACVVALPFVVAGTALRTRRLGWRDAVAEVGAVAGTLPWLWMVLTPLHQRGEVHLVPLSELGWYLHAPTSQVVAMLFGNLAVFAAFGAGAPVRWRLSLPTVALLAGFGSTTVELLQYVLDMGRVASVDDVLLNTGGAVLAALVTRPWWRTRRSAAGSTRRSPGGSTGGRPPLLRARGRTAGSGRYR
jgi:hypothetical protein